MPEIRKVGVAMTISLELAYGERFPRRRTATTDPITPERRADYKAFKKRWKKARKRWDKIQQEGVGKSFCVYGYAEEPPEIVPLEPTVTYSFTETHEEWIARLQRLAAHHALTGEWLEEPEPSLWESAFGDMFGGPSAGGDS